MENDIDLYLLMILVNVGPSHSCVQFCFLGFFFHVLLFLLQQTLVPGEKKN